jgi:hypothetical protein
MDPSYILAGIAAVLWLAFLWLRAPSVLLFFSLLVGQLLSTQIGDDAYSWASSLIKVGDARTIQIILLLLPVGLSLLFLKGRVPRSKLIMEVVPMLFVIATGALFAAAFVPSINQALADRIDIERYRSLLLICASISSLVSAWFTYPKHESGKHGKHHS